ARAFHSQTHSLYGTQGDAYAQVLKAGGGGSYASLHSFDFHAIVLLLPFMAFFNLWSNWGATLYGEVRGASDFRKNIYAMGGALVATTITAVILFLLFSKTFGWTFYNAANNVYYAGTGATPGFPYPALFAASFFGSHVLQFILVAIMSLWFFGWVGTLFLSSTRVIFAAAFDRVLPEAAAKVNNNGVPVVAVLLMLVPSVGLAA